MANTLQEDLRDVSPAQRTLFYALKHRFGVRLGLRDVDLLYAVRRMFVPAHYAPGKTILRAGDCLDLFTVLGAGTVKTTCTDARRKRTVTLQVVGEGHAFGLPSLAHPSEVRRFGAVAHSQSLVGLMTPEALEDVIDRLDTNRRVRLLTYGWNAHIGLLLDKRVLLSLPAADRIWYALARLAAAFPGNDGAAGGAGPCLTQTDIGQLIGATRSTVNRKLKELGKAIISCRRGRYVVHHQPPFAVSSFASPLRPGGVSINDDATRKDVLACLRQQAARAGLPPAAVRAFAQHARLVVCAPGTQIALPDRNEALSLLITGAARVECPGPGDAPLTLLFAKPGWLILGGTPPVGRAGFRAVAQVESCAAVLTSDGLAHVVDSMTAREFLRFLSFGWRVLSHHLWRTCLFLMMDEGDRILHQLMQLAHDFPAPHERGTLIDLDLSAVDIARLVGADETRVGRHLRRLSRERRIAFVSHPRKRIVVVKVLTSTRRNDGVDDTQFRPADVPESTPAPV